MPKIARITIDEFEGLFKGDLRNGTTGKVEDYNKLISKFSNGGITTKEELSLFFAFVLWENSYPYGGHPELDCLKSYCRNNLRIESADYEESQKELAWDTAFWFWNRKCHAVAGKGFWAVLSKLSPQDITTAKGEQRLEHYKKVAKALNVEILE